MEGTAAPVVPVEALPVAWLAMVEREEMAAMAVRVQLELIAAQMVSTEEQVVWAGQAATAVPHPRALRAMAGQAATAVSPEPVALVSVRLLLGKTVGMPVMADQVGLRAPGARAVLPVSEESMATAETAAMVVSLVCRAMEAAEPLVTRPPAMAAMAARAVTQGLLELAAAEAQQEAVLVRPEPVERLALMAPLPQAVGMAAMAELVSARQRPAQLEAMAETEAMADLLATVASEEPAATEPRGRMALRDLFLGNLARTVKPEVRAEWAEPGVLVDRFLEMAVMVASRATVEPEVLAEPAWQARRGRIQETQAKPEGMEAMEPLAEPEGMVESEARPLELGLQVPMGTAAPEATVEMLAWLEMAATVPMVTRRPLMAEPVEMAATLAWLDWEAWADLDQLLAQAVRAEPLRHPAAMEAMAETDLM